MKKETQSYKAISFLCMCIWSWKQTLKVFLKIFFQITSSRCNKMKRPWCLKNRADYRGLLKMDNNHDGRDPRGWFWQNIAYELWLVWILCVCALSTECLRHTEMTLAEVCWGLLYFLDGEYFDDSFWHDTSHGNIFDLHQLNLCWH